jgi:hypothetical protein
VESVAAWILFLVILLAYGWLGWFTIRCLAARSKARMAAGVALILASIYAPFLLAYSWVIGVFPIVVGSLLAAIQQFKQARWVKRIGLSVAIVLLAVGAQPLILVSDASASEGVSRCQGDVAVRTIDGFRAHNGAYPPTVHDFAVLSEDYEDPNCPIYQNVNWLYRQSATGYTVGYWTDWYVVKNVCLHRSGHNGWSCGLNQWGPFAAGETD